MTFTLKYDIILTLFRENRGLMMKQKKVAIKMLSVKGHQLYENTIHTQGTDRAIEILYNMRRNPAAQMVGFIDETGRKHVVGNVLPAAKLDALHHSPNVSTWDHLTLGMMKYKTEQDPSMHVVQVNSRDPIYVLIEKGDIVMDPLMNQIFPPVTTQKFAKGRE